MDTNAEFCKNRGRKRADSSKPWTDCRAVWTTAPVGRTTDGDGTVGSTSPANRRCAPHSIEWPSNGARARVAASCTRRPRGLPCDDHFAVREAESRHLTSELTGGGGIVVRASGDFGVPRTPAAAVQPGGYDPAWCPSPGPPRPPYHHRHHGPSSAAQCLARRSGAHASTITLAAALGPRPPPLSALGRSCRRAGTPASRRSGGPARAHLALWTDRPSPTAACATAAARCPTRRHDRGSKSPPTSPGRRFR